MYASKGDYKQGLHYYRLYHQADKDLLDEKSRKQINELQARNETEKKEQEIKVLKKNNELKAQENLLLKKNNEIQSLRLSRETFTRNALIIGIILVVIILALLLKKYLHLFAFWKKQRYIGQFRLMEQIGSGGMGTVYKAHSLLDKSEIAAVKILKEELFNDETNKKRFKREAMIIDKLEHPHIVKIFERGESKHRLFIAMEFLQGKTLENRINEKGRLSMEESLHIMVQISDAISFIHSKNIIHRDLKPANVMLIETNGHRDFVKLLDFGLAKMEFASRLTQSGNLLGTLQYLAPEQVLDAHSTCANDIFSMGVTFYHMLCGKNPFTGETALDVMNRIISIDPPGIMEYRPDLPGELNDLVMWMLDKKPQHRPPAAVIKDTLQHLINKRLS